MIHNDILRRLRYALSLNDADMIAIFKLVEYDIEPVYLKAILTKEDEPGYLFCRDSVMALFLDGLIIKHRGRKEGYEPVVLAPKQRIGNNEIFKKIRVALTLKDSDIVEILRLADFAISKSELSAIFRQHSHRNYKDCGDQLLRNFLNGLAKQRRP
jgi:uncharacterized protein YehS (DUF1456 family)